MLKRIRDFIYDINDIFVALLIVLVAAGIIIWRSASIMQYPKYLASRSTEIPSSDVIFTPEDLTPVPVDPVAVPGGEGTTDVTDPTANTVEPQQGGTEDPGTTNTVTPPGDVVKAKITIEKGFKGGWYTVADRLIAAGLIKSEDKNAFVQKVNDLNLATRLQIGSFELSSDMDHETMIKRLCNVKN